MPSHWPTRSTRRLAETRVFSLYAHTRTAPHTGREHEVYVLDAPDWVNVVPLTPEGEVVLVRQFRHGTGEITWEIPGGMIDPEDASPLDAARREMLEETGYDSPQVIPIGVVTPNPAIQTNRCHTFVARDVVHVEEPRPDGGEDLDVVVLPFAEVSAMAADGRISHALVIAALHHLAHHEGRLSPRT